jgi:glycosyltransferase involved in cell wall biosynthesis
MNSNNETTSLVSIAMPAFNCEETLAVAIRSILAQTFENWELLVMEDGSNDRTLDVAKSFFDPRILIFSDHSHKGLVPRLNQAVEVCRGTYFARMDADDVAYPERFEYQLKYLEEHPRVDLVGCSMLVFNNNGVAQGCRLAPETHAEICRRPWAGFPVGHPTWVGRTRWFRAHPYDPSVIRAEDQVLLLRNCRTSCFACLPEILQGYREDQLLLRKILVARYGFSKGLLREFFRRREYVTGAGAVLKQFAKAQVDVFAVLTGLNYHILGHRARPLQPKNLQRWAEVWTQVQAADALPTL